MDSAETVANGMMHSSAPIYNKMRFMWVLVKKIGCKGFTHFLKWDPQKSLTKVLLKSY